MAIQATLAWLAYSAVALWIPSFGSAAGSRRLSEVTPPAPPPVAPTEAETAALLSLAESLNSSAINLSWNGDCVCCLPRDETTWIGVTCAGGRVLSLQLESMGLAGQVNPSVLAPLEALQTLSLRNNSIRGPMMDFSGNLGMALIDLSNNAFTGPISQSLVDLHRLEGLRLQNNGFTGPLPALNQSTLLTFDVSGNNLTGPIPQTAALESFGRFSYAGNPGLCGPPTDNPCNGIGGDGLVPDNSGGKPASCGGSSFSWVVVAVVLLVAIVALVFALARSGNRGKEGKSSVELNKADSSGEGEKSSHGKDGENDTATTEAEAATAAGEAEESDAANQLQVGKWTLTKAAGSEPFGIDALLKASAEPLGRSSYGSTYKVLLDGGRAPVVVKRLAEPYPLTSAEFSTHLARLGDLRHPNLLPLLGYYYAADEKLLVYRYVPAFTTLYVRIHGHREPGQQAGDRLPFRWNGRLRVARGVACALACLHRTDQRAAPHGDLRATNVILDDRGEPLLTDYGLAPLVSPAGAGRRRLMQHMAPEWREKGVGSRGAVGPGRQADVWGFGCLLLELITGRVSLYSAPPGTVGVELCEWVYRAVREEWTGDVFDREILVQSEATKGMVRLLQLGLRCCNKIPELRPTMDEVAAEIEDENPVVETTTDDDDDDKDDDAESSSADRSAR